MAQIFPKHKIKDGSPVSKDEVNENLQEIVGEIQGGLGEQNWAEDTFTRSKIGESALIRMHTKKIEGPKLFTSADPHRYSSPSSLSSDGFGSETHHVKVPSNRTWTTLISFDVTCRSSLLWVIASFQQDYESRGRWYDFEGTERNGRDRFFPGVQYAIAIDGGRFHETVIGGTDRSNDRRGESYRHWRHAFTTDLIIPVTAGIHTVSLQGRMVATTGYKRFSDTQDFYAVGNRELIVMEMT
jgi:hypothetical protein